MEPMVNTTAASPSILSIIICNLQAKKIIGIANSFIYVSNSSISTVGSVCVYTKIGLSWISAQIYNDLLDFNTTAIAQVPLTLFLAAGASVFIDNATSIISSIVAVLTKANITISNSNLNTSGKSCRTNGGNGRGAVVQYKNSFCTSGSSSCGYGSISSINCSNILLYFQFLSHSFPYMNKGSNLQGGSGGYGYVTSSATSGAGGGIIFLLAKQALILNGSQLLAEGGDAGSN